jgi:hypothetical protein
MTKLTKPNQPQQHTDDSSLKDSRDGIYQLRASNLPLTCEQMSENQLASSYPCLPATTCVQSLATKGQYSIIISTCNQLQRFALPLTIFRFWALQSMRKPYLLPVPYKAKYSQHMQAEKETTKCGILPRLSDYSIQCCIQRAEEIRVATNTLEDAGELWYEQYQCNKLKEQVIAVDVPYCLRRECLFGLYQFGVVRISYDQLEDKLTQENDPYGTAWRQG